MTVCTHALTGRLQLNCASVAGGVGWAVNERQGEALSHAQQVHVRLAATGLNLLHAGMSLRTEAQTRLKSSC